MKIPVFLENKGQKMFVMIQHPDNPPAGGFPFAIICHGALIGDMREKDWIFIRIADALEKAGIGSIRFDCRGVGESEGVYEDEILTERNSDTEAGYNYLTTLEYVDSRRIIAVGRSHGGLMALDLVKNHPEIKDLILMSTPANASELWNILTPLQRKEIEEKGISARKVCKISKKWFDDAKLYSPLEDIKQYNGRLLILHGDKDELVPVEQAKLFFETAGTKDKTLKIIEGVGHAYDILEKEQEVVNTVADWCKAHVA